MSTELQTIQRPQQPAAEFDEDHYIAETMAYFRARDDYLSQLSTEELLLEGQRMVEENKARCSQYKY